METVSKVLILVPCLEIGGTETATLQLCRALRSGGFQVSVCVYHEHHEAMVDQYLAAGIEVRLLGLPRLTKRPLFSLWQVFRTVSRVISTEKPSVIHVQYMTPTLAPLLAARSSGIPVLATIHVSASHYGRLSRCMVRFVARTLCTAFVCVSQHVQRSFFGASHLFQPGDLHQGRRIFSIPNCVDPTFTAAEDIPSDAASLRGYYGVFGEPLIGFIGRMEMIKGVDVLLNAFVRVAQAMPEVRLIMVGDGSGLERFKLLTESLGIAEKVIWAGRKTREEVSRHFQILDVVAMPSRPGLEGFGLSTAEAMACGRPVVASAVDALPEVVADGETGILVPPEDDLALATALLELLWKSELRAKMGTAGRHRVKELFSFDIFKHRILSLYGEVEMRHSLLQPANSR